MFDYYKRDNCLNNTQNFTEKNYFAQTCTPPTLFAECKIDQFKKSFRAKADYKLKMKLIFLNLNFL